ncbi:hypothetical protein BH09MYX1_BH09MYX1_55330 [soil metagenome]
MTISRKLFGVVGIAVVGAACRAGDVCPTTPCPTNHAYYHSPCGFTDVTSTCTGFHFDGCGSSACEGVAILGTRAETCSVTVTRGDGTKQTASLSFIDNDDDCCPGVKIVVGKQDNLITPFSCVADSGTQDAASVDGSATDAAAIDP